MKTVLRVLFGLFLGAVSVVVCIYLGLFLNGPSPGWGSAGIFLLLLAVTQWIALLAFRHRIAVPVLCGLVLCMTIAIGLIYSSIPIFWEREIQPYVYSITWRSGVVFLLLLAVTQWISLLVFRRMKPGARPPGVTTTLQSPH